MIARARMKRWFLAAVFLVGCGRSEAASAPPARSAAAPPEGGGWVANDPGVGARPARSGCSEADLERLVDTILSAHEKYIRELVAVRWSDCAQAERDLLAVEPTATRFVAEMRQAKADLAAADEPDCKARYHAREKASPRNQPLEKQLSAAMEAFTAADKRCGERPGWRAAVDAGVRALGSE
jgi:hypothetical protein